MGGYELVMADGSDANGDMATSNMGDVADVRGYVEDRSFGAAAQIQGIDEVGGSIDGMGRSCDGLGFVKIEGGSSQHRLVDCAPPWSPGALHSLDGGVH